MYNGLDVFQGNRCIKVSVATYIKKFLEGHGPLNSPMNHENKYLAGLENTIGPTEQIPNAILQKEMGFLYIYAIE